MENEIIHPRIPNFHRRKPNVNGMGLDVAGITFDGETGIDVSSALRTSNRRVYAVGDCCSQLQFTHMVDFMARMVIRNALFYGCVPSIHSTPLSSLCGVLSCHCHQLLAKANDNVVSLICVLNFLVQEREI